jgi:hypothetical protein
VRRGGGGECSGSPLAPLQLPAVEGGRGVEGSSLGYS